MSPPEAWLRGPVPGIPRAVMPVAHSLLAALEELEERVPGLSDEALWLRPGGVASIGFHLSHLSGSTERLLTYARGESLTQSQLDDLEVERSGGPKERTASELLSAFAGTVDWALTELRELDPTTLGDFRGVGRGGLPSTVRGLLFHAAEHVQRHVGQIATTVKLVNASPG